MKLFTLSLILLVASAQLSSAVAPLVAAGASAVIKDLASKAVIPVLKTIFDRLTKTEPIDYTVHLNAITAKLEQIQLQNDHKTIEILNAISLHKIVEYKSNIDATINRFVITLQNTNEWTILGDMRDFLSKQIFDYDFLIMDYFARDEQYENSALKRFLDSTKLMIDNDKNPFQSSVNSFVYRFQISILYSAMKYVSVMELATSIKDYYEGNYFNEGVWNDRRYGALMKFEQSLHQISRYYDDPRLLSSFLNLNNNQVRSFQFKKVFQTYLKNEFDLTGGTACSKNCNFESDLILNDDRCTGKIGNCFYNTNFGKRTNNDLNPFVKQNDKVSFENIRYSDNPERIYDWYGMGGVYQGHGAGGYTGIVSSYTRFDWFTDCDICVCTCDQSQSWLTVRKIYGGVMKAPSGYVVTGVRFVMASSVVYLELEYGRLVAFGIVDPATLYWTGPPSDLTTNTFDVSFDTRKFALDDVYFTDGRVLTGVQLFPSNGFVRTSITGAYVRKSSNSIDWTEEAYNSHYLMNTPSESLVKGGVDGNANVYGLNVKRSDSYEKTSIRFDTNNERSDAGQGTVPFFDGSDIVQDFPLVLSGIGFIHYANEGYGGYLRPILKSADMKHFV